MVENNDTQTQENKEATEKAEAEAKAKAEADTAKEDGDKPKSTRLVDDINLASKRMEEATEASRKERVESERSYAQMKLGGMTEAGQPAEKKEETPKEYNDRIEKELSEGKHNE